MSRFDSTLFILALTGACAPSPDAQPAQHQNTATSSPQLSPDLTSEIGRETDRAYALKRDGNNGPALEIFVSLEKKLRAAGGGGSVELASNLDDQATVLLRLGRYEEARNLYNQGLQILGSTPRADTRLADGIKRRLETLASFERAGVRCDEPLLVPSPPGDGGETLPYFPPSDELEAVFFEISHELTGCIAPGSRPVSVRMVVTGDGRITSATTRGQLEGTKAGKCFAEKLMRVAPKYQKKFPRFRACYRNATFPFPIHD